MVKNHWHMLHSFIGLFIFPKVTKQERNLHEKAFGIYSLLTFPQCSESFPLSHSLKSSQAVSRPRNILTNLNKLFSQIIQVLFRYVLLLRSPYSYSFSIFFPTHVSHTTQLLRNHPLPQISSSASCFFSLLLSSRHSFQEPKIIWTK